MSEIDSKELYDSSIVIDGCAPLASWENYKMKGYEFYCNAGISAICPTIWPLDGYLTDTIKGFTEWYTRFRKDDRLMQVLTVDDIYRAKKENRLGVILSFQGTTHLESNLKNIEIYYRLGIRQILLCYNRKNAIGDGCTEPKDGGLSVFGEEAVKEMNRLGIIVDCAHTGHRTSLEAIEASNKPVIFSHGNSYSIYPCERNLKDDQALACAKSGGIVGVNACDYFISEKPGKDQTAYDLIDHIDYYVKLIGIDHVSLGMDYFQMQIGVMDEEEARSLFDSYIENGIWSSKTWRCPAPFICPPDIQLPKYLHNLVPALINRGYSALNIKKILGENYLRVAKECWK